MTASLTWELQRLALFASFDEAALDGLAKAGSTKVFAARKALFHEGDPGGSMAVVLSGQVKVSAFSAGGKECVLSFVGPGEVLGEITLLDGGPRTATCTALEDTRVFMLARKDFLPVLQHNPAAALHIIEVLCESLRNTSRMVEDAAFLAAGPRLARAILRTPEVLLLDLRLGQESGFDLLRNGTKPMPAVVVVTSRDPEHAPAGERTQLPFEWATDRDGEYAAMMVPGVNVKLSMVTVVPLAAVPVAPGASPTM